MGNVLIVQQYFGLGDIIWGQSIAHHYIKQGYRVLWPCQPEWVEGLRRAYPAIEWIDYSLLPINYENRSLHEHNGFTYLPMRYAEWILKRPYKFHMISKYDFVNLDWKTWKDHAMPFRNEAKEAALCSAIGLIQDFDKFNFIATKFGSNANHEIKIEIKNDYRNVELKYVPGFSLFDWCWIIENAQTIHAVSSSTLYLFELLNLSAKEVHLYTRKPVEKSFEYVEFLFSKPYILHYDH